MALSPNRNMKFEALEDRRVMTANVDIDLDDGILTIEGTDENDIVEITYEYDDGQIDEVVVTVYDEDGDKIKGAFAIAQDLAKLAKA